MKAAIVKVFGRGACSERRALLPPKTDRGGWAAALDSIHWRAYLQFSMHRSNRPTLGANRATIGGVGARSSECSVALRVDVSSWPRRHTARTRSAPGGLHTLNITKDLGASRMVEWKNC